jgi:hypothetical protein
LLHGSAAGIPTTDKAVQDGGREVTFGTVHSVVLAYGVVAATYEVIGIRIGSLVPDMHLESSHV